MAKKRQKRFLDLFSCILLGKNNFFLQTYFFGELDIHSKNFNFLMNIDSKTPKIDFFTLGFFVGIRPV
jgi:hypothetical protein